MMLVTDWEKLYGLPRDLLKGVCCISGMYDLEPVYLSYRNRYVKLDEAAWRRNSAIHNIPAGGAPPLIIGYGELETDEFKRQPKAFLAAWQKAGHTGQTIEVAGAHHFAASYAYNDPDSPVAKALLARIGV
jgi:arylformamidase